MEIKLNKLAMRNFKGVKKFDLNIKGKNATITAENGVGKTTIKDNYLWILFGKDSDGSAEFGLRPLDGDNNPIRGLVVSGELSLDIDGVTHVFVREHHENVVKKQVRGFTTVCTIDEVPVPITKYNAKIEELIAPEEVFKLLTDLDYFNDDKKFHHTKRREVLLNIAGEIGVPEGYEGLFEAMADRSMDDYKKVLKDRVKAYTKQHAEIVPRIDENQRKLEDYVENAVDVSELEKQRHDIKNEIIALDIARKNILDSQTDRQVAINKLNKLKDKLAFRERVLKNDTSGVQDLLDEKAKLVIGVADKRSLLTQAEHAVSKKKGEVDKKQSEIDKHMKDLDKARKAYLDVKYTDIALPPAIAGICFHCNQELPEEMKASANDDRQKAIDKIKEDHLIELKSLADTARSMSEQYAEYTVEINRLETELAEIQKDQEKASIELEDAEVYSKQRVAGIDEALTKNIPLNPAKDPEWNEISEAIAIVEAEIGDPVPDRLADIEASLTQIRETREDIAGQLRQADNAKEIQPRIDELKTEEVELAQKIADAEKELEDIKNYCKAECVLIEDAVNGKFKHVKYRLFKDLLKRNDDGSIDTVPCCDAMLNGVPYSDMSDGEKIFAGIDTINVLSDHFRLSVPLFIDRAETFTKDREANSQVIELHAVKGITALEVKTNNSK